MTRSDSYIYIEGSIKEIIAKELNIDKKYFTVKVYNKYFSSKSKINEPIINNIRFHFNFENIIYSIKDNNEDSLLNLNNNSIILRNNKIYVDLMKKVRLNPNYSLTHCLTEVEMFEDIFADFLIPFIDNLDLYSIDKNNTYLSKNNRKNRSHNDFDYEYKKSINISFKHNIRNKIQHSIIKHLFHDYFNENKSFDININDLEYFAEAFVQSGSILKSIDNYKGLVFSDDFKKFLNFKDIKEFQNIKKILMLNFHC